MAENKKLLNLAGELSARLMGFLASESIEIVPPELVGDLKEISFIMVKDNSDFNEINTRYDTVANNIFILTLTPLTNSQDFLLKGGRGILDENWLDTTVGTILLKKLFQKAGTVHLDEMFGTEFPKYETCKLNDHLRLGHYSDIISIDAFEQDYNIVSIRGFLYNVIYYFTYLHQAGIGSSPFEIEYAHNSDVFVVNLHVSVKNFVAEYLFDCFGEVSSTDPLKYLLRNAYKLADNTDITYIENPSKLVITGIWKKENVERGFNVNQLILSNIKTSKHILDDINREVSDIEVIDESVEDLEGRAAGISKKPLPGNIVEMVLNQGDPDSTLNKQPKKTVELMAHIASELDSQGIDTSSFSPEMLEEALSKHSDQEFIDELSSSDKNNLLEKVQKKNISDAFEEEIQKVKGQLEEDDNHLNKIKEDVSTDMATKVSSMLDVDALNSIIASSDEEEDNSTAVIGGSKKALEDSTRVGGGQIEKDGDKITLKEGGLTEDGDNITVHGLGKTEDDDKVTIHGLGQTEEDDKVTIHESGVIESEERTTVTGNFEEDVGVFKHDSYKQQEVEGETVIKDVTESMGDDSGLVTMPQKQRDEAFDTVDRAYNMAMKNSVGDGGTIDFGAFMRNMKQSIIESGIDPEVAQTIAQNSEYSLTQAIAAGNNGSTEGLTADYLLNFKEKKFNESINEVLDDVQVREQESEGAIADYFKKKLQKKIADDLASYSLGDDGKRRLLTEEDLQSDEVQGILTSSIQDVFENEWQVVTDQGDKFENLEEQIINSLGDVLPIDKELLSEMAHQSVLSAQGEESFVIKESLFDSFDEGSFTIEDDGSDEDEIEGKREEQAVKGPNSYENNALIKKAKQAEINNKNLQKQIQDLKTQVVAKDKALATVQNTTKDNPVAKAIEVEAKTSKAIEKRTEGLKEKLDNTPGLSEEHKKELKSVLDREKKLILLSKKAENEIKKLQVDNQAQKSKFTDDISTLTKTVAGKDSALRKAKDQIQYISNKKDKEIQSLTGKISSLNKMASTEEKPQNRKEISNLRQENQNLSKMVEVYKNQAIKPKNKDNSSDKADAVNEDEFKNQIKSLSGVKNKLESKLANFESQNTNLSSKVKEQSIKLNELKKEKEHAERELKKLGTQAGNVIVTDEKSGEQGGMQSSETASTSSSHRDVMNIQAKYNDENQRANELEGRMKGMIKKVKENEKAIEKAKELTVSESDLKKKLFSATKNMKFLEDKLAKAEKGIDSSGDSQSKDALRDRVELEKLKEADYIKSKKIGLLEKELKRSLTETVSKGEGQKPNGDLAAGLRASEAKLKLKLMETEKKVGIYESKMKSLESRVSELSGDPLSTDSSESDRDKESSLQSSIGEANTKKELEQAAKLNKQQEDKIRKLEAQLKGSFADSGPSSNKENEKLQGQLDVSQKKIKDFETKVKDLQDKVSKLDSESRREQVSENKEQSAQDAKHRSELLAADRKTSEFTQRIKDLEKKVYQTETARTKALDDVKRLSADVAKSKAGGATTGSAGDDAGNIKSELNTAQRKISLMESQFKSFEKQVMDSNGKLESANNQIKQAKKQKELAETMQKQEALAAKRQVQEYQNKFAEMEKKFKEMTGGNKSGGGQQVNMAKYKNMETNSKKLMGELSKARNQAAEEKSNLNKAKAENTGLQNKLKQMEKEVQRAKQAIENMNKNKGRKAS